MVQLAEQDVPDQHHQQRCPAPLPLPLVVERGSSRIPPLPGSFYDSTHVLGQIRTENVDTGAACMKAVLEAAANEVFAPASVIMYVGSALHEAAFGHRARIDQSRSVQLALDFLQRLPLIELGRLEQPSSMQGNKQQEHRSVVMPVGLITPGETFQLADNLSTAAGLRQWRQQREHGLT